MHGLLVWRRELCNWLESRAGSRPRDHADPDVLVARRRHAVFEEGQALGVRVNRQHKHGRYSYDAEQFGLTAEALREAFAAYSARFLDAA